MAADKGFTGVNVFARVRPAGSGEPCCLKWDDAGPAQYVAPAPPGGGGQERRYNFDGVFAPDSQEAVYERVGRPVVHNAITGYNGTIFAYGQTGSGKTHTMFGPGGGSPEALREDGSLYQERGLVPRISGQLFDALGEMSAEKAGSQWEVNVAVYEVYNEDVIDLQLQKKVTQLEGAGSQFRIRDLSTKAVASPAAMLRIIEKATANRHMASTAMNQRSSRSHTVVQINVIQRDVVQGTTTRSQVNLVDLAGSERVGKTLAEGQTALEGARINLSLMCLGKVIKQLGNGDKLVSFRDSKLTRVLQNSLGGNAITSLICAMSPSASNLDETIGALRFVESAKKVRNKARVNKERTAAEWEMLYRQLEEKMEDMQIRLQRGGGSVHELAACSGNFFIPADSSELDEVKLQLEQEQELSESLRAQLHERDAALLSKEREVQFLREQGAEGRAAQQERDAALHDAEAARKARQAAERGREAAERAAAELQKQLAEACARAAELHAAADGLQAELSAAREKCMHAEGRLEALSDDLRSSQQELAAAIECGRASPTPAGGGASAARSSLSYEGDLRQLREEVARWQGLAEQHREQATQAKEGSRTAQQKLREKTEQFAQVLADLERERVRREAAEAAAGSAAARADQHEALLAEQDGELRLLRARATTEDALVPELRRRLQEAEGRLATVQGEAERASEEAEQQAKQVRRFREELRERDELIERCERSAEEAVRIVNEWRCPACKARVRLGDTGDTGDEAGRLIDLLRGLVREKGDQMQELERALHEERAQREILAVISIVMQEAEDFLMKGQQRARELIEQKALVVPPTLLEHHCFLLRQMSRVIGVLGKGEFYTQEDELRRVDFLQRARAAEGWITDFTEQVQDRTQGDMQLCPICGGSFPRDKIKKHAGRCSGAADAAAKRAAPSSAPETS
eukprot:TRINITY_DN70466_c0_g1_i1.p1 TRINITY_DN70466_c0_g1~~TRINITY_DN70466_c0_g1_i1.p1  ORF type:complete len:958 (+),score=377.56 TRINITY_DN70466_c0_g1_i1:91-2874(+)